MKHWLKPLVFAAMLSPFAQAQAGLYRIDFSATDLNPVNDAIAWTDGPVSGSIVYAIQPSVPFFLDIHAVNFKAGGDIYKASEVGGIRWPSAHLFGGLDDGIFVGGYGKDFTLVAEDNGEGFLILGNSAIPSEYWSTWDISFRISEVPEPGTTALLLVGAAAALGLRRRRKAA